MKWLKGWALGLLMVVLAFLLEKTLNAQGYNTKPEGEMEKPRFEMPKWMALGLFIFGLWVLFTISAKAQVVDSTARNNLDFLYYSITEKGGVEASFCLIGEKDTVKSVQLAWIDSASKYSVFHRPSRCPQNTIGILHFHPIGSSCELSNVDIVAGKYSSFLYEGLGCLESGERKFLFWTREWVQEKWKELDPNIPATVPDTGIYTILYRYRRRP